MLYRRGFYAFSGTEKAKNDVPYDRLKVVKIGQTTAALDKV